ncbi:MAG: hypothetical protein ABEK29_00350 [Bradymonadaceae bacterium]
MFVLRRRMVMSRLVSTVSHLLLGLSLVLSGSGCSCSSGAPAMPAGSTPAQAEAPSGADDGSCCDADSGGRDGHSSDECCDGGDCRLTLRHDHVVPVAHLDSQDPMAELPVDPPGSPQVPVAERGRWRHHFQDISQYRAASEPSDGRSTDLPRYLALQVLRI